MGMMGKASQTAQVKALAVHRQQSSGSTSLPYTLTYRTQLPSASSPFLPLIPSLLLHPVPKGTKVHLGRCNSLSWDLLRVFKTTFSSGFSTSNWFDKRFNLCIPLINSEDCSPPPSTLTVNILQMLCSFLFFYSQLATLLACQRISDLGAKQPFSLQLRIFSHQ